MGTVMNEVTEFPAQYNISILPLDWDEVMPDDRHHWEILVTWRGGDRYSVDHWPHQASRSGGWDWERNYPESPGARDEWLAAHRFSLQEAREMARRLAPDVGVNGHSATEVLARYEKEKDHE